MILVDTSIWVDHFKIADPVLDKLLKTNQILVHPFVIGELALGPPRQRAAATEVMTILQHADVAGHNEYLRFVDQHGLHGRGMGFVDVHLLASAIITPDTQLWSRDRRLHAAAEALGVAAHVTH